jgi:hypothetical protein
MRDTTIILSLKLSKLVKLAKMTCEKFSDLFYEMLCVAHQQGRIWLAFPARLELDDCLASLAKPNVRNLIAAKTAFRVSKHLNEDPNVYNGTDSMWVTWEDILPELKWATKLFFG